MRTPKPYRRSIFAASLAAILFAAPMAQAASYLESQDYADYVALLARMSNTELMSYELPSELMLTTAECGAAIGLTGLTFLVDTVPMIGMVKTTQKSTEVVGEIIKTSAGKLKAADAPFITSMLEALAGVGAKAAEWSPNFLKNFLVQAAPNAFRDGVYASRIAGVIVAYRESHPKTFTGYLEAYTPHIVGGAISTAVELPLNGLRAGLDRDYKFEMPLTREAFNLTRAVAAMSFSDSGGCRQHWYNYQAVVNEILMRSGRVKRPVEPPPGPNGEVPGPIININIGTDKNPAVTQQRYANSRPHGGSDNGAQDFRPASKSSSRGQ